MVLEDEGNMSVSELTQDSPGISMVFFWISTMWLKMDSRSITIRIGASTNKQTDGSSRSKHVLRADASHRTAKSSCYASKSNSKF